MDVARFAPFGKLLVLITVLSGLTACIADPYYSGPYYRWPHHYHYPSYYDYYYYPTIDVYFHYSTGYYYYRNKDRWVHARTLPPRYRLDPKDRIIVRVPGDRPYKEHDEHRRAYKPYPEYRRDPDIDHREREYNRKWHDEFNKEQLKRQKGLKEGLK